MQGAAIWDGHLREVYDITRHASALSKKRFKNEPAKLALFANIEPSNNSRTVIFKNGSDLVPAWEKADPIWEPVKSATLPALKGIARSVRSGPPGSRGREHSRALRSACADDVVSKPPTVLLESHRYAEWNHCSRTLRT